MAHSQELENWDDDFDFGSPRNSPVPTAAPIHHAVHRTRSQAYQQRSHANLHSQSSLEHGLTHRQTSSRTNLGSSSSRGLNHPPSTTYLRPKENRQARYSGNSEDWDMDMADTTARALPLPPPPAMPLASTSAAPKPPPLSVVPTAPSPQQLVDHDSQIIHLNARRSPEPSENVSPTMSAFSIPLSANSSVRNPAHSIGGSSTNFLLHSGRRSLLEMEKGRQDRERRRLRKKSRPSGVGVGGAPMMDDDDDLDAHEAYLRAGGGGGGSSGLPRRYIPPPRAAGAGGDNSSSELDESGDDRGNLSELEEELASPSKVARVDPSSARIPRQQPPSTNTNLKPSSSRPTLSGVISTSRGLISSVVTSTPPSSSKTLPAHSPSASGAAAVAPPSKLSRKTSNSNVIQKSSHHSNSTPFLSSGGGGSGSGAIKSKSSVQPSAPTSPQAQIHAKSIEPTTSTSMSASTSMSPPRRSIDMNSIHTTNHHQQQQQHEEGAHLNDCGSSIAASSHKARQPLLSRLSSLKRWGKAHSPSSLLSSSAKLPSMSMSGVAFPTNLSSTDFRSGSPSPSPPHVSPMTSPQKPPVPSSSSAAATPSRSKFGLLRRPSLQFRNNESATAANEPTSTSAAGGAELAMNPQVSTIKDEGRRGLNPFRRVSITGMKRLVGDSHHPSPTDSSTAPLTKTPDSKRSSYKPESSTQTPASENKSSGSAHQRTLSFMNRMRSKSGGNESPSQAKPTINSVVSAAGTGTVAGASNGESSSATRAPHTVGRSAAMAKAPKPPVRTAMGMMISTSNKNKNNNGSSSTSNSSSPVPSSPASTNSPRQLPLPLPSPRSQPRAMSPLPTFETNANANSKGSVRSSTLMTTPKGDRRAMHPHMHTHTPLSSDQDVTPRPSRHRQPEPTLSSRDRDRDRTTPGHHHHHERERTAKGTMPMPMPMSSSSSISRATSGSGSGSGSLHADSTPLER
ncbi:hypothetical protein FRC19_009559 [Serendipita sp. 401]|nr:hypothetical protein FRC19_009559 [Serendipita sp. 401]